MAYQTPIQFSEQLIKGKIAELVFSQMLRNSNKFTVIPFGYENSFPEIAQYASLADDTRVLDTIRSAPDFALVSHDKRDVYLVEVKYRSHLDPVFLVEMAAKIQERWKSVQLFIATPTGFFFGDCATIIESNGHVPSLDETWISKETQAEYLVILNEFISQPRLS